MTKYEKKIKKLVKKAVKSAFEENKYHKDTYWCTSAWKTVVKDKPVYKEMIQAYRKQYVEAEGVKYNKCYEVNDCPIRKSYTVLGKKIVEDINEFLKDLVIDALDKECFDQINKQLDRACERATYQYKRGRLSSAALHHRINMMDELADLQINEIEMAAKAIKRKKI